MTTTSLRPLPMLTIASPCTVPWDSMKGDDRTRHCKECKKDVHNLIEMTREEVTTLLAGLSCGGETPCVQMYQRADGTIVTADCQDIVRKKRVRLRVATALMAAGSLMGCSGADTTTAPATPNTATPPAATSGQVPAQAYTVEHVVEQGPTGTALGGEPTVVPSGGAPAVVAAPTTTTSVEKPAVPPAIHHVTGGRVMPKNAGTPLPKPAHAPLEAIKGDVMMEP